LVVVDVLLLEHLQRDGALQAEVLGAVDDAHAALAERGDDAVAIVHHAADEGRLAAHIVEAHWIGPAIARGRWYHGPRVGPVRSRPRGGCRARATGGGASAPVGLDVDRVPLQPAMDLHALFAEQARDGGDVALVLGEEPAELGLAG